MSPLPNMAQAESLGLTNYLPSDMCPCGREKRAPGHLMGHACRASFGLCDQPEMFTSDVPLSCSVKACEACDGVVCQLSYAVWHYCVDRLEIDKGGDDD